MSGVDVVRWARGQVGQHEQPWGSNRIRYWAEIGLPGLQGFAWCGAFAYDALTHGGADMTWTSARRFVDTVAGLADARAAGIFRTGTPRPGDPVWFDLAGGPGPEHVAIAGGSAGGHTSLLTIDGNWADRVQPVTRPTATVIGYAQVHYWEDEDPMMIYNAPGNRPHEGQWVAAGPARRCLSRAEFDAMVSTGRAVVRELPADDPFWRLPDITGGQLLPTMTGRPPS